MVLLPPAESAACYGLAPRAAQPGQRPLRARPLPLAACRALEGAPWSAAPTSGSSIVLSFERR